jgi:hypothetical protein
MASMRAATSSTRPTVPPFLHQIWSLPAIATDVESAMAVAETS